MATYFTEAGKGEALELTKVEAVSIIVLLAAQLAQEGMPNNFNGACPSIIMMRNGKEVRLVIYIRPSVESNSNETDEPSV